MPSRDYLLRLIEQLGQLLRRVTELRDRGSPQEGLQTVMAACERLFGLDAVQLFQFSPDQHYQMLAESDPTEDARNKILIYAALNQEAGLCYLRMNQPQHAAATFLNALRLTLRARRQFGATDWPDFAPPIRDLVARLRETPLDADTAALLAEVPAAER